MTERQAMELAQAALVWLAARPEALGAFLLASGADAAELRARAADPELLGFVLDHLLGSDAWTRDFAAEAGVAPEAPARARAALPGGYVPDWT